LELTEIFSVVPEPDEKPEAASEPTPEPEKVESEPAAESEPVPEQTPAEEPTKVEVNKFGQSDLQKKIWTNQKTLFLYILGHNRKI